MAAGAAGLQVQHQPQAPFLQGAGVGMGFALPAVAAAPLGVVYRQERFRRFLKWLRSRRGRDFLVLGPPGGRLARRLL